MCIRTYVGSISKPSKVSSSWSKAWYILRVSDCNMKSKELDNLHCSLLERFLEKSISNYLKKYLNVSQHQNLDNQGSGIGCKGGSIVCVITTLTLTIRGTVYLGFDPGKLSVELDKLLLVFISFNSFSVLSTRFTSSPRRLDISFSADATAESPDSVMICLHLNNFQWQWLTNEIKATTLSWPLFRSCILCKSDWGGGGGGGWECYSIPMSMVCIYHVGLVQCL